MKKFSVLLVILGAFALAFAACDNGTTSGGGTLTVTDIPAEYNGKYLYFETSKPGSGNWYERGGIVGRQGVTADGKSILTKISGGKAVTPLWLMHATFRPNGEMEDYTCVPYNGNDTGEDVWATIYENPIGLGQNPIYERSFPPITFSNGSAEISWNVGGEWSSSITSLLAGSWYYQGKEIFSITADGTGVIGGRGGYSVQERYDPREARFMQGSNVTGQFTFLINGDRDKMWIQSGTGPFTSWANLGAAGQEYVIYKE
jgi:hypothetical protein